MHPPIATPLPTNIFLCITTLASDLHRAINQFISPSFIYMYHPHRAFVFFAAYIITYHFDILFDTFVLYVPLHIFHSCLVIFNPSKL
ncbi:hypothetical protein FB451DRAFT_1238622 [Mycena latifolia]|nr:hypothetical protein FB451DRAFT_1238622 [Mycena latifolia]